MLAHREKRIDDEFSEGEPHGRDGCPQMIEWEHLALYCESDPDFFAAPDRLDDVGDRLTVALRDAPANWSRPSAIFGYGYSHYTDRYRTPAGRFM